MGLISRVSSRTYRNMRRRPPLRPSGGLPPMDENNTNSASQSRNFYEPVEWSEFFDEKLTIKTDYGMDFNVYRAGDVTHPAIVFVHGGGFTGLIGLTSPKPS